MKGCGFYIIEYIHENGTIEKNICWLPNDFFDEFSGLLKMAKDKQKNSKNTGSPILCFSVYLNPPFVINFSFDELKQQ